MAIQQHSNIDTIVAGGTEVIDTIKDLIHEGNVRRISIKQDGRTIAEFPLTLGVVGAALAPALAGIGAVIALITDCSIEVERFGPPAGVGDNSTPMGADD